MAVKEYELTELMTKYCDPERFMPFCKQCPDYGRAWSCPPDLPSNDEFLGEFKRIFVVGLKVVYSDEIRARAVSAEKAEEIRRKSYGKAKRVLHKTLVALEREFEGGRTLAAGKCEICSKCARQSKTPCRFPESSRYSFTAFGFDLALITQELLKFELLWEPDGLPVYDTVVAAFLMRD